MSVPERIIRRCSIDGIRQIIVRPTGSSWFFVTDIATMFDNAFLTTLGCEMQYFLPIDHWRPAQRVTVQETLNGAFLDVPIGSLKPKGPWRLR